MISTQAIRIADFCKTGSGGTPSRSQMERYYERGTIPWVKSGELRESVINHAAEYVTEAALKESSIKLVPAGAILLAMYGATVGRLGILGIEATTNQAVCHIVPDPKVADTRYVFHAISNRVPNLIAMGVGGAQPNINQAIIKDLAIPLPPLPEQIRIAAILDQADALRLKRRDALAQLDSLTQSIFIEMFGELSTNSKGWKTCTVGDVSDCIVPGRDKPKSFSGNIPWVTTADLKHLEITHGSSKGVGLSESEIKDVRARVIPSGSVIISCVGDLGIVSIADIPMVVNQQLHSFQCHSNFSNIFLMYCLALQKPFMLAKASSTTLPYMNKTVCNSIPVISPPLELQQTFANRIQVIDALKTQHRISQENLDALFASLQHRAFRGEL